METNSTLITSANDSNRFLGNIDSPTDGSQAAAEASSSCMEDDSPELGSLNKNSIGKPSFNCLSSTQRENMTNTKFVDTFFFSTLNCVICYVFFLLFSFFPLPCEPCFFFF